MTFPAGYPSRCASCDERIHPGDLINYSREDGATHADCIEAAQVAEDSARPEPEPCTTCWLTHPEGACDR
jgi:hypothetical protein